MEVTSLTQAALIFMPSGVIASLDPTEAGGDHPQRSQYMEIRFSDLASNPVKAVLQKIVADRLLHA